MSEPNERLQVARAKAGYENATDAARAFGWNENTYRSHENGERGLKRTVAEKYAHAFRVSAGWLLTGEGAAPGKKGAGSEAQPAPALRAAPVAGIAQAGLFREAEDLDDFQHDPIAVPPDPEFPHARQAVWIAEGDSMNAAPVPITPGSYLVCVDYEDMGRPLENGWTVIVERTKDGGSVREWSVKEVHLFPDRVEFRPRSTNKRHKTIATPMNPEPDDDRTVRVLARVRYVFTRQVL